MKQDLSQTNTDNYKSPLLIARRTYTPQEVEELNRTFSQCAGFVKMMAGVANGCALTVMKYAIEQITDVRSKSSYEERPRQPHPRYRGRAKAFFKMAEQEVAHYRSRLLYPATGDLRFFHVEDMPPTARKKYGAMTDRQYFEFWESTAGGVYVECRPLITSLWNKYRLSLQNHGVPCPDKAAWGITALTCLQLAVETWERAMRSVSEAIEGRLTDEFIRKCYRPFLLQRVADKWQVALIELSPETATYKLTDMEERNIALGINQLRERWISPDLPFDSTIRAVEDFDEELFRTRGEAKKAIRELSEMRNDTVEDVKRRLSEGRKKK